jgi:hypothetical protein
MLNSMDFARYRIEFRGEVRTSESFGPGFLPELAALVERYVPAGSSFLEWGSGLSTQLLAEIVDRRGGTLVSVEQDADYAQAVLAHVRSPHVVRSIIADLTGPKLSQADTGLSYSTCPLGLGRGFDFILIDGRRRVECALTAFILSAPPTIVALHDYRRTRYQLVSVLFDILEDGPHFRVLRAKAELAGLTAAARSHVLRQCETAPGL